MHKILSALFVIYSTQVFSTDITTHNMRDLGLMSKGNHMLESQKNSNKQFTKQPTTEEEKIATARQKGKELQNILTYRLLKSVYDSMPVNDLFGGGQVEEKYQDMLNEERAKLIELGLDEQIAKQMLRSQGIEYQPQPKLNRSSISSRTYMRNKK